RHMDAASPAGTALPRPAEHVQHGPVASDYELRRGAVEPSGALAQMRAVGQQGRARVITAPRSGRAHCPQPVRPLPPYARWPATGKVLFRIRTYLGSSTSGPRNWIGGRSFLTST